jgi:hypothetical protein
MFTSFFLEQYKVSDLRILINVYLCKENEPSLLFYDYIMSLPAQVSTKIYPNDAYITLHGKIFHGITDKNTLINIILYMQEIIEYGSLVRHVKTYMSDDEFEDTLSLAELKWLAISCGHKASKLSKIQSRKQLLSMLLAKNDLF